MTTANRLTRVINKVASLPDAIQPWALSKIMGRVIPFAGTAGTRVEKCRDSAACGNAYPLGLITGHVDFRLHSRRRPLLIELQ